MNALRIFWMNLFLVCGLLFGTNSHGWGQIITTVAGGGVGDGGPATEASLSGPLVVIVDASGDLYIADTFSNRVRRVDGTTGIIATVAGAGGYGFSGDGGPATKARFANPRGMFVDGAGHLYIADTDNDRVRRVDMATGIVSTVAGTGAKGFSGDGGPATQADTAGPQGVFVDGTSTLYIAANNRVRQVDAATGVITTVAGTGRPGSSGDGGPATEADFLGPSGLFVDEAGHLYIADTENHRIRRVDAATGVITTVAGTGEGAGVVFKVAGTAQGGFPGFSGDGGPATEARLWEPSP